MLAKFHSPPRAPVFLTGAAALIAWAIALVQALPRLVAGPICTTRADGWSLAGHCPACFVAVALSALFLTVLLSARVEDTIRAVRVAVGRHS